VPEWHILKLLKEATNPEVSKQNVPEDTEENTIYVNGQTTPFLKTSLPAV
jgi:hypothetical protein